MKSTQFKFSTSALVLLLVSTIALVVLACKIEAPAATTYTITVNAKGGTGVDSSYTVNDGQSLTIPTPSAPNDTVGFGGWTYTDGSRTVDFVSGQTIPTKDITIYAIWLPFHTVTINANGGTSGKTTTITKVLEGKTLALAQLVDGPTFTDKVIAYWSTLADDYTSHFEFDKSPVNGDITIYAHWRPTLDLIKKKMEGDWVELQTQPNASEIKLTSTLYKVKYSNSDVYYCGDDSGSTIIYDDNDPTNTTYTANLNVLKSMVIDTSRAPGASGAFYPPTYNPAINNYYVRVDGWVTLTSLLSATINQGTSNNNYSILPTCTNRSIYTYSLNSYVAPDNDDIVMDKFQAIIANNTGKRLLLKNYSSLLTGIAQQFTLINEDSGITYRLIKK